MQAKKRKFLFTVVKHVDQENKSLQALAQLKKNAVQEQQERVCQA